MVSHGTQTPVSQQLTHNAVFVNGLFLFFQSKRSELLFLCSSASSPPVFNILQQQHGSYLTCLRSLFGLRQTERREALKLHLTLNRPTKLKNRYLYSNLIKSLEGTNANPLTSSSDM